MSRRNSSDTRGTSRLACVFVSISSSVKFKPLALALTFVPLKPLVLVLSVFCAPCPLVVAFLVASPNVLEALCVCSRLLGGLGEHTETSAKLRKMASTHQGAG